MTSRLVRIVLILGMTTFAPLVAHAQTATTVPKDPAAVGDLNLHQRHPDGFEGQQDFDSHTSTKRSAVSNRCADFSAASIA